jgi:hypothetical protein
VDGDNVFFIVRGTRPFIKQSYWRRKNRVLGFKSYEIISTFEKRLFIKIFNDSLCIMNWKKGINLLTFKMLNGVYPTNEYLIEQIKSFKGLYSSDFKIPNMIVQGKNLITIDGFDFRCGVPRMIDNKRINGVVAQMAMDKGNFLRLFGESMNFDLAKKIN